MNYVSLKTAELAKEKGFNEPVFARYFKGKYELNRLGGTYKHNSGEVSVNYISAPFLSELAAWFRDIHFLHPYIVPQGDTKTWMICNIGRTDVSNRNERLNFELAEKLDDIKFNTYEQALEVALFEMLNII